MFVKIIDDECLFDISNKIFRIGKAVVVSMLARANVIDIYGNGPLVIIVPCIPCSGFIHDETGSVFKLK